MKTDLRGALTILTRRQRWQGAGLLVLMLIGMLLEMVSLALVVPTVSYLTNGHSGSDAATGGLSLTQFFHINLYSATGAFLLIAAYVTKTLFVSELTWLQNRYSFGIQRDLAFRLFKKYLDQSYCFHLNHNSSVLLRNIISEVPQFTTNVIIYGLQFMSELFPLLGVVTILLLVEPYGAAAVSLILLLVSLVFFRFTKARVQAWGTLRQAEEAKKIQHVQQGLGAIKELLLHGKQDFVLSTFSRPNRLTAEMGMKQATMLQLPRLWLELLAVLLLALLTYVMLLSGDSKSHVMATIGLFAVAAFRILPSVNRIIAAVQAVHYGAPVISILKQELSLPAGRSLDNQSQLERHDAFNSLSLQKVTYYYAEAKEPALKNISLDICSGDRIGIIGMSGSGKSTLVDLILGLMTATDGQVRLNDRDVTEQLMAFHSSVGYVPQSIYLLDDTLENNIAFGVPPDEIVRAQVQKVCRMARLDDFIETLPLGVDTVVGERGAKLSGGQRQRIGIARALYRAPSLLVLDEATSALDSETEKKVMEAVHALSKEITLIVVAHRLSTLTACSRIYQMENGEIIRSGPAAELINMSDR